MTREELKTATNDELIDELNYCGYDSYYGDYRDDIVAEIKKRMQEPILDKIKEEVELKRKMYLDMNDIDWLNGCDYVLSVIDKYRESNG